jgi:uncharacterized membrane protein
MDVSIVSTYLNCALLDLAMVLVQTKSHCNLRGVAFSLTPNSALVLGKSVAFLPIQMHVVLGTVPTCLSYFVYTPTDKHTPTHNAHARADQKFI